MALEMRVYQEVTDIDPKVMGGLTWRQLAVTAVLVLVIGVATTVLVMTDRVSWLPHVIAPLALPLVVFAWVKPMGLRMEQWFPQMIRVSLSPQCLRYVNDPVWSHQKERFGNPIPGRNNSVVWKEAGKRREAGQ